jgi:hypothetical protein
MTTIPDRSVCVDRLESERDALEFGGRPSRTPIAVRDRLEQLAGASRTQGVFGFSTRQAVDAAASMFDQADSMGWDRHRRARVLGGHPVAFVGLSPGSVRLRQPRAEGWELDAAQVDTAAAIEVRQAAEALVMVLQRVGDVGALPVEALEMIEESDRVALLDGWFDHGRLDLEAARRRLDRARVVAGVGEIVGGRRGTVTEWSRKSRLEMIRKIARVDWTLFQYACSRPGWAAGMVTLTAPSDWLVVFPDGRTAKRALEAFRAAYERQWGPAMGPWKLEFQHRGAPHFHLFLPCQRTPAFRAWVSVTWARIVGADQTTVVDDQGRTEYDLHLLAGTGVDFALGARCTDPKRLAVYFSKHSAAGAGGSKEYQHRVPVEWLSPGKGPGRFWGVWGAGEALVEVEVEPETLVELSRTLRRWGRSDRRPGRSSADGHAPPMGVRKVWRRHVDLVTGEITWRPRKVRRRFNAIAHNVGTVLYPRGPDLGSQLARQLTIRPYDEIVTTRILP